MGKGDKNMKKEIIARYKKAGIRGLTDKDLVEAITGKTCEAEAIYLRDFIDNTDNIAIRMFKDIFVKYLEQKVMKQARFCRSSKEVYDYLFASMRGLNKEIFKVIYLTSKNRVIETEDLFSGSLRYLREYSCHRCV
mgnify:CR=1 FL=1